MRNTFSKYRHGSFFFLLHFKFDWCDVFSLPQIHTVILVVIQIFLFSFFVVYPLRFHNFETNLCFIFCELLSNDNSFFSERDNLASVKNTLNRINCIFTLNTYWNLKCVKKKNKHCRLHERQDVMSEFCLGRRVRGWMTKSFSFPFVRSLFALQYSLCHILLK